MSSLSLSDCDITFSKEVRREIRKRYKEQMKKWSPSRVQSNASPMNKALAAMLTEIWEPKRKVKPDIPTSPRRRRGGFGVYDKRKLRLFGEWFNKVLLGEPQRWRVTAFYSDVIKAKDADEAARLFGAMYPVSDWLIVDKEVPQ